MGPLGVPEMIFIFVAALVIFGPKKLPELGKKFGKGMAEFRRASGDLKATFQREMDNIERETRMQDVRQAASNLKKEFDPTSYYDGEDDYYDEYDYESSKSKSTKAGAGDSSSSSESSSSTGDSTGGADSSAETPSSDSSSKDVQTASASAEPATDNATEPAAEKSTA